MNQNRRLHPLLQSMEGSTSFLWLGNLGWVLHAGAGFFAFDLDLDLDLRLREPPVPAGELGKALDVMLITHEHGDHFNADTASKLLETSECVFVLPASCLEKAASIGIPDSRIVAAVPGRAFELGELAIEPIHALHGHHHGSVYRGASFDDCGYVVTVGGIRILQPGDSVLLHEHLELEKVDVLFVSPTEHNMKVEASLRLIEATDPDYILPQHFGTYRQTPENSYWTRGYPDELLEALPAAAKHRFHKLEQGVVFSLR